MHHLDITIDSIHLFTLKKKARLWLTLVFSELRHIYAWGADVGTSVASGSDENALSILKPSIYNKKIKRKKHCTTVSKVTLEKE